MEYPLFKKGLLKNIFEKFNVFMGSLDFLKVYFHKRPYDFFTSTIVEDPLNNIKNHVD